MAGCCGCCSAIRPRYKRLIDSIYPEDPQDGLVKSSMEKLTFYALSQPGKLDRIGEFMTHKLNRDLHRRRIGYVFITMEALDKLLLACHAHTINPFVESYLKMVQKLLEYDETDLQCVATTSFIKFANIEEDTPSYHRQYDFFVSKFSSMCHSGHDSLGDRIKIRSSGLRGLQGVVRKTVSDDLQVNIWDPLHMDKIIPSLLFNMHDPSFIQTDPESPKDETHPAYVAETVLRDVACRASYGNIRFVVKPILIHLDNHNLWVPNEFAVKTFKIIMFSVQNQYGYLVIQNLMTHLDTHTDSDPTIKASIVEVLSETILINAGGSIGPSVLEVFHTLLHHLRLSVDTKTVDFIRKDAETKFQEAILNTIGEFPNTLPDYQKIEIMMFVIGKMPQGYGDLDIGSHTDVQLQTMLLKTLLKVSTKYKTVNMANAFPPEYLRPLLRASLAEDPGARLIVQEILHTLIDRHDNQNKLKTVTVPKDIAELELTFEKSPRQDIMFMKKFGLQFYIHLYENMQMESNKVDNFEALYRTMALISIEMGSDEIVIELFRLAFNIQNMVCTSTSLPVTHKCAIHALLAAYMNLVSQLTAIPALRQHTMQVIDTRRLEAPHLLPDFAFNRTNSPKHYPKNERMDDSWLFNQATVTEALASSGHDTTHMAISFTEKFILGEHADLQRSASDIQSILLEIDSVDHSPASTRRNTGEEVTFESLKKMLNEDVSEEKKEEHQRRRLVILERFRTAPFEDICAMNEAKSTNFHDTLNEILDMVSSQSESSLENNKSVVPETKPVFEVQFPELFVY